MQQKNSLEAVAEAANLACSGDSNAALKGLQEALALRASEPTGNILCDEEFAALYAVQWRY